MRESKRDRTSRATAEQHILGTFIRKRKVKVHRHRCLSCGQVTKYVFCPPCHAKRMKGK